MTILNRILNVPSSDPDDARRRRLLNILLIGVALISVLGLIALSLVALIQGADQTISMALRGAIFALLGTLGIFAINHTWSGQVASLLFVLLLTTVFTLSDEPRQVVDGRSVFLFTIPILMASVLLRSWASFLAAGLAGIVISLLALTIPGYIPPLPTIFGFFAFALVSWLSARSLESALEETRRINRELDQRVELRTRELRDANQQLAQANERLRELDRLKSRFISMVSHELRTPLSAIQGFSEMLLAGVYGPLAERQRTALGRITDNTQQLLHLVSDLLDRARIEAGQLTLHNAPFSPAGLVEDIRSTLDVLARSKGLMLTTEIAPDLPDELYGDEGRLRQIMVNLVNNAIKFTEVGDVRVRLYRPNHGAGTDEALWAISVSDTGPGIAEGDRTRIFDPFRRVDDSATREHLGVGLGLSIVKELTELMGGEIQLTSMLGEGSTFVVTLPLHDIEEVSA
ncbi:MAG: sensor histidine kinase [Anaerolineae bacterium]